MLQAREVGAKILRQKRVEVDLLWLGKETSLTREAQVSGRPVGTVY